MIDKYIIEDGGLTLDDISSEYGSVELNKLTYKIIGACMEIHSTIGKGFSEAVYKDCLSIELDSEKIRFEREKKFEIIYKGRRIPHHYFADFIVEDSIVLEIKSQSNLIDENIKQILNYLAASKCKYGILINFGENSLKFKRIVLTK